MKIGFVSRIGEFPEKEWKGEFEIARENGATHLELIVNYPFFGPQTATPKQIAKLKKLAKENNLELILHLLPNQYELEEKLKEKQFNLASKDEEVRKFSVEEVKRTIRIAEELGAKLIILHGGSFSNEGYKDALKISRKSLEELNLLLGTVKIAVENLPARGHLGNEATELPISARDLIFLVEGLESIGICFDIGHANTVGNPIKFYEEIKGTGKVWDMHIHDNKGDKDDHLVLRKGNIDFEKFIGELKENNYQGYFSLELDTWPEHPEAMSKDERVEALKYLRS
jgi:sugar phosphate isomerase/epimerase